MKPARHTPEPAIRKLREAERLLGEPTLAASGGRDVARSSRCQRSLGGPGGRAAPLDGARSAERHQDRAGLRAFGYGRRYRNSDLSRPGAPHLAGAPQRQPEPKLTQSQLDSTKLKLLRLVDERVKESQSATA
jgi:hypothetical protein